MKQYFLLQFMCLVLINQNPIFADTLNNKEVVQKSKEGCNSSYKENDALVNKDLKIEICKKTMSFINSSENLNISIKGLENDTKKNFK